RTASNDAGGLEGPSGNRLIEENPTRYPIFGKPDTMVLVKRLR
ncbi:MAG: hypothetical protein ACI9VS_000054, partial [Candidatus Binatia bacterium]